MSMQAMLWAMKQETGSPEAKLVLMLLADAAGVDGEWFFGNGNLAWIAVRAEMTAERLREILAWLSARGLVVDIEPGRLIILPFNESARALAAAPEAIRASFSVERAELRAERRGE